MLHRDTLVATLEGHSVVSFFRSATRIVRLLYVLIIAVAIVWITNSVDSSVQSALPYILVALIAWDFTRVLTVRHRRQKRDRVKTLE